MKCIKEIESGQISRVSDLEALQAISVTPPNRLGRNG